jgi:hypothetical protein
VQYLKKILAVERMLLVLERSMQPGVWMTCKQARCVLTLFEDYRLVEIEGKIDGRDIVGHDGE